jgi:hypothetical protein
VPPAAVATPTLLTDPGYLFIAPLLSAVPTNTVAGSVFTDAWAAAWLPLGATENGTTFTYSSTVEAISVAEFFDPIKYVTTGRAGSIAFNLANFSLTNYRRALNGGTAALTPTSGTGATALSTLEPGAPGSETRVMIGWESLDNTVRIIAHQTIQGGEVTSAFQKAPAVAMIPCTFNFEVPASGKPFSMYGAGTARLGA